MKYLSLFFIILLFLKSFYYGTFELKTNKNKFGGFGIYFLSLIGLLTPLIAIFIWY